MITSEKNTFEEVSIVTMCFNMGMDKLTSVKGNKRENYYEYYVQSIKRLCKQFRNVIVFCDQECYDNLKKEKYQAYLICMKLQELEKMKSYNQYIEAFRQMSKYLTIRKQFPIFQHFAKESPIVKAGVEAENLALYTVLNHSKVDLMVRACKINPFNTDYFYWLDGGCVQDKYGMIWKNWNGEINHRPKAIRCSLHMKHWSRFRLLRWTKKNIAFCFCEDQISACFFGGKKEAISLFQKKFDETVMEFMKRRLVTSEQGIITWMIKKDTKLFDLVRSFHYDEVVNNVANGKSQKL